MPESTKRQAEPRRQQPEAKRGPDGLTLGERIELCMQAKSQALGRIYRQSELRKDASTAAGRGPRDRPVLGQQALSLIMLNRTSETPAICAIAAALGVNGLWLQYGVGPASYIEGMVQSLRSVSQNR